MEKKQPENKDIQIDQRKSLSAKPGSEHRTLKEFFALAREPYAKVMKSLANK